MLNAPPEGDFQHTCLSWSSSLLGFCVLTVLCMCRQCMLHSEILKCAGQECSPLLTILHQIEEALLSLLLCGQFPLGFSKVAYCGQGGRFLCFH